MTRAVGGGRRPDPLYVVRSAPAPIGPKMPPHLSPAARAFWRRHAPDLVARGVLTPIDGPAFAILADAFARWSTLTHQLNETGALIPDDRGGVRTNPLVMLTKAAADTYLRYALEFGLTPGSRSRVSREVPPASTLPEGVGAVMAMFRPALPTP